MHTQLWALTGAFKRWRQLIAVMFILINEQQCLAHSVCSWGPVNSLTPRVCFSRWKRIVLPYFQWQFKSIFICLLACMKGGSHLFFAGCFQHCKLNQKLVYLVLYGKLICSLAWNKEGIQAQCWHLALCHCMNSISRELVWDHRIPTAGSAMGSMGCSCLLGLT